MQGVMQASTSSYSRMTAAVLQQHDVPDEAAAPHAAGHASKGGQPAHAAGTRHSKRAATVASTIAVDAGVGLYTESPWIQAEAARGARAVAAPREGQKKRETKAGAAKAQTTRKTPNSNGKKRELFTKNGVVYEEGARCFIQDPDPSATEPLVAEVHGIRFSGAPVCLSC